MLGNDNPHVLRKASQIYANLKKRGELLEDADILIAATALTYTAILVTDDAHFERIEELEPENWLKNPMEMKDK